MKTRLTIGRKVIAFSVAIGVLAIVVASFISFKSASDAIDHATINKLVAVRDIKKHEIELFFQNLATEMKVAASSKDNQMLYDRLVQYHNDTHVQPTGPYDVTTPEYEAIWTELGEYHRHLNHAQGYYDVFLICAAHGHVMFTVAKESDLGTNLGHGPYKDTGLAKVWRQVKNSQAVSIVDFESYAPSNGDPAAFVGAPIYKDGSLIGTMVVQLPTEYINQLAQERAGLGETGDTYIVGSDMLMRSDSRFQAGTAFKQRVDTEGSRQALNGATGTATFDRQGEEIVSAYAPLEIPGLNWAFVTEVQTAEVEKPVIALRNRVIVAGTLLLIPVIIGAVLFARSMTRPIQRTTRMLEDIATGDGDLTKRLQVNTNDELADMATWFNTFVDKLNDIIGKTVEAAQQVVASATELSSTAEEIAAGAEETSSQADTIASSTEEMSATAEQIAQNCADAAKNAETAMGTVDNGRKVVAQTVAGINQIASRVKASAQDIEALSKSAEKIGEVINVINNIADQTNLLALNAAIEAARAGEQGRGFAVVADEVRKLAESTAQSTQEIAATIKEIQERTGHTVASMMSGVEETEKGTKLAAQAGEALQQIAQNNEIVMDMIRQVATAAEQQTATTGEITQNIQQVAEVTQQSAQGAQQSAQAATELAKLANQLQQLVGRFKLTNAQAAQVSQLASPAHPPQLRGV